MQYFLPGNRIAGHAQLGRRIFTAESSVLPPTS